MWSGPYQTEGLAAYQRAVDAGMSSLRATVLGHIGSFKDCWKFRKTLAELVHGSVRTVQRALTQGREVGLIGTARGKITETPPGAARPVSCGFSHRWTIGWGQSGKMVQDAIAEARAKAERRKLNRVALATVSVAPPPKHPARPPARRWTAEELDAELAKTRPPDKPE